MSLTKVPFSVGAAAIAAFTVSFLTTGCETGGGGGRPSARVLPAYEPALVKTNFQNVRTTAYTHTEADHRGYGAHNALGGELHAAGPAIHRAELDVDLTIATYTPELQAFSDPKAKSTSSKSSKSIRARKAVAVSRPTKIGSAAADWGRWPAGTTFRLLSTGQVYCVDDYGWALSGRNTIDLYMPNERAMNTWGVRDEPIQILHWGNPQESLRLLAPHAEHKHIRRMILELQGNDTAAAGLR